MVILLKGSGSMCCSRYSMASSWGMVGYIEFMSMDTRRGVWLVGSVVWFRICCEIG